MAQLFDYFVASRPMIERWADAVQQQDEQLQHQIEGGMPRLLTLKDLGQDEFNILARCAEENDFDVVEAVGEVDLVKAISEVDGPWLMAFRQANVDRISRMSLHTSLIERWVKNVAQFNERNEDVLREVLTAEAANTLKELCGLAVKNRLGVYTCFYG